MSDKDNIQNKSQENKPNNNLEGRKRKRVVGGEGILLGVTGGIACGKTTVADMIENFGGPIVDYDLLSRVVVEPGRPALSDIADYFGPDVINKDQTLNRKKLSGIVFSDPEKRKKLQSFIYPRLGAEYESQINDILKTDSSAIIQVVVPLLIEQGMQNMFDYILVVYITKEEQIIRLMNRDNISEQEAGDILKAQMPIEEKKKQADFIIDNSGSIENAKIQAEKLWETLSGIKAKKRLNNPT